MNNIISIINEYTFLFCRIKTNGKFCSIFKRTSSLLSTKMRNNTSTMMKSIMSETSQDLDDDDLESTLNNTTTHNGNGNGTTNGTHSISSFASLNTNGSNGNLKESHLS